MNMPVLEHSHANMQSQTSLPECNPVDETSLALNSESRLQEFRVNVQLSKEKIVKIIDSDQYSTQAQELNEKAVQLATQGYVQQAGVLLGEAEKLLEYAANRGKEINRNLIITVLHNQAFCHQQGWSLQRCANYIEALIYNLNCEIKQEDPSLQDEHTIMENVVLRDKIIQYYLLFCAINSQLKLNDGALIAAKRAHSMVQLNSQMLQQIASISEVDMKTMLLLNELSNFECHSEEIQIDRLTEAVSCFYHIWKNKCKFPQHELRGLTQKYLQFSIGNIMQMEPISFHQVSRCEVNLSTEAVLERVINLSISYFTMATELRILAVRTAGGKQAARETRQYRQSQCYHLTAIILITYYFPFKMLYLEHILTSYHNHYGVDIEALDPYIDLTLTPQQLFYTLLINGDKQMDEIKSSTAGNSEKGSSGRSSLGSGRKSYLNKLQQYVRASLKKQNYQQSKDMAKLNNYYYVRGELGQSKQKDVKRKQKSSKQHKQRACLTSKHSAQKTPRNFVSNQISPKKHKASSKSSNAASKRGSINHTTLGAEKKTNIVDEYFRTEESQRTNKGRSKSKRHFQFSKENKQFAPIGKTRQTSSPRNTAWKAANLTNRHMNSKGKSRESELKGLKSTSKVKSKLHDVKSKKKVVYYK